MTKSRLEAFTDGVIAIIITIMVLEFKVPHGTGLNDLRPLLPTFLSYLLSFVFVAIYWNNHHHFFLAVKRINGAVLWGNANLLFWLSLIPFATSWLGESHFASAPVGVYGVLLLCTAIAYQLMVYTIIRAEGTESDFALRLGSDLKGWGSLALYVVGVALAWFFPFVGCGCYAVVACLWLIPDRRFERGDTEPSLNE